MRHNCYKYDTIGCSSWNCVCLRHNCYKYDTIGCSRIPIHNVRLSRQRSDFNLLSPCQPPGIMHRTGTFVQYVYLLRINPVVIVRSFFNRSCLPSPRQRFFGFLPPRSWGVIIPSVPCRRQTTIQHDGAGGTCAACANCGTGGTDSSRIRTSPCFERQVPTMAHG
jgi:hypothetical protein